QDRGVAVRVTAQLGGFGGIGRHRLRAGAKSGFIGGELGGRNTRRDAGLATDIGSGVWEAGVGGWELHCVTGAAEAPRKTARGASLPIVSLKARQAGLSGVTKPLTSTTCQRRPGEGAKISIQRALSKA